MDGHFQLKVITPERIVLDTPAKSITATARDGQLTVLPRHEPLVTALGMDVLTYKDQEGVEHSAAIIGGILEVGANTVTVLTDTAELGIEIDEARATQAKARAEAEKIQKTDKLDTQLAELALTRAIARLKAVEMVKSRRKLR
ncbi:MAG: ATP synthase F1 subunit epsilon [Candidatus Melainabacteria bacterium]|nr:ATP synthase F1 subunit epsilon [Candidatus Melainabacteria bacterium]